MIEGSTRAEQLGFRQNFMQTLLICHGRVIIHKTICWRSSKPVSLLPTFQQSVRFTKVTSSHPNQKGKKSFMPQAAHLKGTVRAFTRQ